MVLRLPDQMLAGAKTDLQPNVLNAVRKLFQGGLADSISKLA